jgi:GNAT superfamily N-acetyltransferase
MEWRKGDYVLTDERDRMDVAAVHRLLAGSYWAAHRPASVIARTIAGSLCFGLFHQSGQVGFGRFLTDGAACSWFGDFIIAQEHRGHGVGTWMLELMLSHPQVRETRVFLGTKDAHGLYEKFGFQRLEMMRLLR